MQHNIFDKRTKSIVHSFGADEGNKNISKYVRPAIHGDGFCVAMGSSASNLVNFFDLRYTGKGVVQDVSLHGKMLIVSFLRSFKTH